jgi:O-acetyl-ADP-ribose deacetylase (regulator of RNase III)
MITVCTKYTTPANHVPVYIGRGSVLGNYAGADKHNSYGIPIVGSAADAVLAYRAWLFDKSNQDNRKVWVEIKRLAELSKSNNIGLQCFCKTRGKENAPCHGDVIKEAIQKWIAKNGGKDDILTHNSEYIVNPVNCVGVMGKGLALQVKLKYPNVFRVYKEACNKGLVKVGKMLVVDNIINFPTKQDWRNPSKLEWIESGLKDLRQLIIDRNIQSISIPKLGCGLGGLDWHDVKPLIDKYLSGLNCTILLSE